MSSVLTIRAPEAVQHDLESLAEMTGRSRSWLAMEAIKEYLEREQWRYTRFMLGLQKLMPEIFPPHRKLRLCSTNGLRVQIKFFRNALRDLGDEAALVSYFQATFNTVQSFPNSVNAVSVMDNFSIITRFVTGNAGKPCLYAA